MWQKWHRNSKWQLWHQIARSVTCMVYFTLYITFSDFWGNQLDCFKPNKSLSNMLQKSKTTKALRTDQNNTVSGIFGLNFARPPVPIQWDTNYKTVIVIADNVYCLKQDESCCYSEWDVNIKQNVSTNWVICTHKKVFAFISWTTSRQVHMNYITSMLG